MSEYKLKTGKLGDKVIGTYRKVEDAFVDRFLEKDPNDPGVLRMKPGKLGKAVMQGYQTMEDTVVGAYKKVEDAFVDTFLEKKTQRTPGKHRRLCRVPLHLAKPKGNLIHPNCRKNL